MESAPRLPTDEPRPTESDAGRGRRDAKWTRVGVVVLVVFLVAANALLLIDRYRGGSGAAGVTGNGAMAGMDHGAGHGAGAAGGGHDMSPVDVSKAEAASAFARGNQPWDYTLVDGVKEYRLTTKVMRWSILPTVQVGAYTYNGTVPGPLLRLTAGDRVRFVVKNELPEPTSIHWHGLIIPNSQDGAADVTQPPIQPGETFTYEYTAPNTPGTFFYHTHFKADRQQTLGLYGALLIEPRAPVKTVDHDLVIMLGEWTVTAQGTVPAMDMAGMEPNYFTFNGKSYPETEPLHVKVGDRVRIRLIGSGQFIHPIHLHGVPFKIMATDGYPVPEAAQLTKDTVLIGPGERYDLEFVATEPGKWLFHCHINHHMMNDGAEEQGAGGLAMMIHVSP